MPKEVTNFVTVHIIITMFIDSLSFQEYHLNVLLITISLVVTPGFYGRNMFNFFKKKRKDVHYLFMYRRLACIQVLLNKKYIFLYYNAKINVTTTLNHCLLHLIHFVSLLLRLPNST